MNTKKTSKTNRFNKPITKIANTKNISKSVPKIRVLFVCTGNTCRSPMLEFCFKSFLKQKKVLSKFDVKSAGILAEENDLIADNAILALKSLGVVCNSKNAKLLDQNLMKKSDYIICMTEHHKASIEKDFAKANVKVITMAAITNGPDVPDPYGCGIEEYSAVLEYFIYACEDVFSFIMN